MTGGYGSDLDPERVAHDLIADGKVRGVSRRSLLQRAALAAVMAAASTPLELTRAQASVDAPSSPVDNGGPEDIDPYLYTGDVVRLSENAVSVETPDGVTDLTLVSGSTVWKGQESAPDSLAIGDRLMLQTDAASELLYGWANLACLRGVVTDVSGETSILTPTGPMAAPDTSIQLSIAPYAQVADAYTGQPIPAPPTLPIGTSVYGVGLSSTARTSRPPTSASACLAARPRPPRARTNSIPCRSTQRALRACTPIVARRPFSDAAMARGLARPVRGTISRPGRTYSFPRSHRATAARTAAATARRGARTRSAFDAATPCTSSTGAARRRTSSRSRPAAHASRTTA